MYPTKYHRPENAAAAVAALGGAEEGKFLAGGQTLLPTMKQHLAAPSDLVDLSQAGLTGISAASGVVTIGAMTPHAAVAASAEVASVAPVLTALAGGIGDPAVRHLGTLGGSIANNDPAADYPAALLGLGATIVTDRREIAAEDFFEGMFATALEEDEVITQVRFPRPRRAGYAKFRNPASRYALVGVLVAELQQEVRVAITGAGDDGVFRHAGLEAALAAEFSEAAIDAVVVSDGDLLSDLHASAAYRAHLIKVMAKRAVAAC